MKPPGRALGLKCRDAATPAVRPTVRAAALAALGLLVATSLAAPATADGPGVVTVAPNPATDGDAGEHVVDPAGATNLTLSDGETTVAVPAADSPVALAAGPGAARNLTDHRVVAAPDLALANGDERLRLRRGNRTLDTLAYGSAPEAERYENGTWRPRGLDPRPVRRYGPANVTAFALPDSPALPLRALRSAEKRLLLVGYTLSSPRVVDALVAASGPASSWRAVQPAGSRDGGPRRSTA